MRVAALQAAASFCREPRAMPWATLSDPFGVKTVAGCPHLTTYGVSTVTAITTGAVRSAPFTNSIVFTTASGRFGDTAR